MENERKIKLRYVPNDKINEQCYELVERLFGIQDAMLTNRSMLEDFLHEEIPGHNLVPLSSIPESEREKYHDLVRIAPTERISVWYPPVTKEEQEKIDRETRVGLLRQLEIVYDISFDDYPNDEDLYVWKVSDFVKRKRDQNGTMA